MYRLPTLLACILLAGQLFAQDKFFKEFRLNGMLAQAVDVASLNDGTFICLVTQEDPNYRRSLTATGLLHISQNGEVIEWLNIGSAVLPVMFGSFILRNDSLLLEGITAPDSADPHFTRKGVNITTYCVHKSPLSVAPVSFAKIETAFSVHTQKFKALNWMYDPGIGYDSEICRFDSDSGTGYKIRSAGNVRIGQLIETNDGGVIALGDVFYPGAGNNVDIYMLRLDKALNPVWEKTYGLTKGSPDTLSPSLEVFREARMSADSSLFLLGHVNGINRGGSYYVMKSNANGEMVWQRSACDTVTRDSVVYYSHGMRILPLPGGGCIIAGYRNSRRDAAHTKAFTMSFDRSGNITNEFSATKRGTWIAVTALIPFRESFRLFGYETDLRSRNTVPFMCKLNKKGKFVPFRD